MSLMYPMMVGSNVLTVGDYKLWKTEFGIGIEYPFYQAAPAAGDDQTWRLYEAPIQLKARYQMEILRSKYIPVVSTISSFSTISNIAYASTPMVDYQKKSTSDYIGTVLNSSMGSSDNLCLSWQKLQRFYPDPIEVFKDPSIVRASFVPSNIFYEIMTRAAPERDWLVTPYSNYAYGPALDSINGSYGEGWHIPNLQQVLHILSLAYYIDQIDSEDSEGNEISKIKYFYNIDGTPICGPLLPQNLTGRNNGYTFFTTSKHYYKSGSSETKEVATFRVEKATATRRYYEAGEYTHSLVYLSGVEANVQYYPLLVFPVRNFTPADVSE